MSLSCPLVIGLCVFVVMRCAVETRRGLSVFLTDASRTATERNYAMMTLLCIGSRAIAAEKEVQLINNNSEGVTVLWNQGVHRYSSYDQWASYV